MKKLVFLVLAGMLTLAACNKNDAPSLKSGGTDTEQNDNPIALSDIPQAALDYLNANFPGYTIIKAFTEDEDGTMLNTIEIAVSGKNLEVKFDSNWKFVKSEDADENEGEDREGDLNHEDDDTPIALTDIPQSALDYITQHFPGYSVVAAYQEDENGQKLNTVEISNSSSKIEVKFDSNWNFVRTETKG